jgi:hypothetical protein
MKIQNLIVSFALMIPFTFSGSSSLPASSPTTAVPIHAHGTAELPSVVFLNFLFPKDFTPDPIPARTNNRTAAAGSDLIKLNGRPAPAMPLPNLDASVQLVVGPVGAPSQGTIVFIPGEGHVIITHDHFTSPALDERDDLYIKEHGETVFTGHIDIAADRPDGARYEDVNIIRLGEMNLPRQSGTAAIASSESIAGIRVGDWVQVVYNAGTQSGEFVLKVALLQVTFTGDTTIQVYDPHRLINKGDSGGAVYFDGELIGVLWSIGEYGYGPGVNVSLLYVP